MNATREEMIQGDMVLRLSRLTRQSIAEAYLNLETSAAGGSLILPPSFPAREGQRQVIERAISAFYRVPLRFTWTIAWPRAVAWEPA